MTHVKCTISIETIQYHPRPRLQYLPVQGLKEGFKLFYLIYHSASSPLMLNCRFIISQTLDRQPPSAALPERLGNALAAAGPSITLAAAAETLAFGMAALTPMPAVRNFSAVAAVAVILDYILQVSDSAGLLEYISAIRALPKVLNGL